MDSLLTDELAYDALPAVAGAKAHLYKTTAQGALRIHVLPQISDPAPAIIFFFPGGWRHGKIANFLPHAQALAAEGWLAILADYRVYDRHGTEPFHAVEDALDCYAWVRANAEALKIDLRQLVVAGGSSGGHLAACVGLFEGGSDKFVPRQKEAPSALVLFNPVLDVEAFAAARREKLIVRDPRAISPLARLHAGLPPTLILHGTADQSVPVLKTEEFARQAHALGLEVEVQTYPGKVHGFYNPQKDQEGFELSFAAMKDFLARRGLSSKGGLV